MSRLRDDRGVAMITVLFIGATLTVVATTASISAIHGLRASTNDSVGSQAVAFAEAGLERFLDQLRKGGFGLSAIMTAGCATPPVMLPSGTIGNGSYTAELTVYNPATDPQVPPSPYNATLNPGSAPCQGRSADTKVPQLYAVTATGTSASGKRAIRSIVTISGKGLPVGVFVNNVNANGNPDFANLSLFSRSDILGREKMGFTGDDLFYTQRDVYGESSPAIPIPAAAHSAGLIYTSVGGKRKVEHPPNPNCTANSRGTPNQSVWDGSVTGTTLTTGCGHPAGYPPTSKFTSADLDRVVGRSGIPQLTEAEYSSLKAAAQASGIYCSLAAGGATSSCIKAGGAWAKPETITTIHLGGLTSNFVAYFEFTDGDPMTQDIKWNASSATCESGGSGIVVVRNGGATLRGGGSLNGNVIAPEGIVDSAGNFTITGSTIAKELRLRGTATFRLTSCHVNNVPAPLLSVSPGRWSEVDR